MSRLAKTPVELPKNVKISFDKIARQRGRSQGQIVHDHSRGCGFREQR